MHVCARVYCRCLLLGLMHTYVIVKIICCIVKVLVKHKFGYFKLLLFCQISLIGGIFSQIDRINPFSRLFAVEIKNAI